MERSNSLSKSDNEKTKAITFAIVGCGAIAQRHAAHIGNFGHLTAVCDIDVAKAESLSEKYPGTVSYSSIDNLLDGTAQFDVAVICTPNGLHAAHALQAMEAGHHVVVEKPMALTTGDCRSMIQTSERTGKKLFAVKQNRYNPPVAAIKKLIDEGKLGRMLSCHLNCCWNRGKDYYENPWKGTKRLDGGTLFTQFSHFIDLLYWLFGEVEATHAFMDNMAHQGIIEFEDCGSVALRFKSGCLGSIHFTINSFGKNMEGSLTVFGEKGTVKIGGQYLNELEYQNIEGYTIAGLPKGNPPNDYGNYVGSMSNHGKVYENIVDVLINNAPLHTDPYDAMMTVEIIERIYRSAIVHQS